MTKHDHDKVDLSMLPTEVLESVSRVLMFGADKYGRDNWKPGMKWMRLYSASLRHLFAWQRGEDEDPESDLNHLDHAICSLLFLRYYAHHDIEGDDRELLESDDYEEERYGKMVFTTPPFTPGDKIDTSPHSLHHVTLPEGVRFGDEIGREIADLTADKIIEEALEEEEIRSSAEMIAQRIRPFLDTPGVKWTNLTVKGDGDVPLMFQFGGQPESEILGTPVWTKVTEDARALILKENEEIRAYVKADWGAPVPESIRTQAREAWESAAPVPEGWDTRKEEDYNI